MAKSTTTNIATTASTATAIFDPTALLEEHSGNAGIKAENCALPYLQIASALSDVCKRGKDKYIEGLSEGDIYNTVTKEFYTNGIQVIPCQVKEAMVAWTDEPKGTPKGEYSKDDEYVRSAEWKESSNGSKQLKALDGNVLVETYTYLVIYITPEGKVGQALLPMSKTKLAVAKQWNTLIKALIVETPSGKKVNPAMYMTRYNLTTIPKSNAKGDWHVYGIEYAGLVDDKDILGAAIALAGADVNIQSEDAVIASVSDVEEVV